MLLYYWLSEAPKDHTGGPWRHREFDSATEKKLLEDLLPFLHAYCEASDHICESALCGRDTPPKGAKVIYTGKE